MRKVIVLAGTKKQFQDFTEERKLNDIRYSRTHYIYADSQKSIVGIKADDVIVCGTFWENKNANKLAELAKSRL